MSTVRDRGGRKQGEREIECEKGLRSKKFKKGGQREKEGGGGERRRTGTESRKDGDTGRRH